ncbi:MAG: glycosyltransferase family 39 protein [Acidimicrobiales bacterium]|nr:glycosyltransferase family 39 protein [Acidimicrobiales bacterium]
MSTSVRVESLGTEAPLRLPSPNEDDVGSRRIDWVGVYRVLVVAGILAGAYIRVWYITHRSINSDPSVVGLMAGAILHGHFSAFYWGQYYGGVEPYVVALFFALFGHSALSLGLAPMALVAVTSVITWRIALRLVADRGLAALAGVLVWIMPAFGITTIEEYGFRDAALVSGTASLLLGLRILDGRHGYADMAGFGLAVGVGWWASPESAFLTVPACVLVLGAVISSRPQRAIRFWLPRLSGTLGAMAVGALPWLWSNTINGYRSLNAATVSSSTSGSYSSHLHTFLVDALPVQLGLRRFGSGGLIPAGAVGDIVTWVVCATLAGFVVLSLACPGRSRLIGAAVLAFPLAYSINPLTSWWLDGRYSVYLLPLVALTVAIGCERLARLRAPGTNRRALHRNTDQMSRRRAQALMAVTTLVAAVLALAGFFGLKGSSSLGLGTDPNLPTQRAITILEERGATFGFANYWVAYRLDYLSGERLTYTPVPGDTMRSLPIYKQVTSRNRVAWLFVPPDRIATAASQFGTPNLETGYETEASFLAALRQARDPYSVIHTALLDAIVPQRPVTPKQVGIGLGN